MKIDMVTTTAVHAHSKRAELIHKGLILQYLTIGWNSIECLVALVAGFLAGSIALVGFGLDSAIEVTSSLAAIWRLRHDHEESSREAAEQRSMQIIGISFLLLSAYVLYESINAIVQHTPPSPSLTGIILAGLSLTVMPLLVHFKRHIAAQLESGALEAETRQTEICAYLSAILLAGLGLNAWLGLWWADPFAGLVMVPLIAWEGLEAVRGRTCCAH